MAKSNNSALPCQLLTIAILVAPAVLTISKAEIVRETPSTEGTRPSAHAAPGKEPKIDILPGYDRSLGEVSGGSGEALMLGGTMPRVVDIQDLPQPDSAGARLLNQICAQCHGLPSPDQHSAEGWLPVISRMKARMRWMTMYSNIKVAEPDAAAVREISDYLQRFARKPNPPSP